MAKGMASLRDLPGETMGSATLGRLGALLRAQYADLKTEPVPERLQALVQRLAEEGQSPRLMRGR